MLLTSVLRSMHKRLKSVGQLLQKIIFILGTYLGTSVFTVPTLMYLFFLQFKDNKDML